MIRPQKIGLLRKSRSKILIVFYLALGMVLLAIVGFRNTFPTSETQSVDTPRTLNRGLVGDPESLNPHYFSSDQAATILRDVGEGLVSISADGELVGGVAKSWELSENGLVYTFRLRADARWSTGIRVTAQDFVSSYQMLVDPGRASSNVRALRAVVNADLIAKGKEEVSTLGVKAVRDDLLEVHLEYPQPYFLQMLSHPSLYPVVGLKGTESRSGQPSGVSNGAYYLDDWTKGSEIILRKNPEYWGAGDVYFETVRYHVVEEGAEFNRFRSGELDITSTVSAEAFSIAKREFSNELKVAPRLGVYYYGYNLDHPVFSKNRNLRKALSLAIDRELLVHKILARGEEPAYGWVPSSISSYTPQSLEELQFSKEARELEARRFYGAAGYGPTTKLKVQLRYNTSDVQRRVALAISAMWRDVLGVETELVNEEFKVLLSNIRDGSATQIFRLSWIGDYNDPQTFLELFESNHAQNLTRYSNAEFDRLLRAARTEASDAVKRRSLLEEAEKIALSDHPVIPLYTYVSKHLVSKNIVGWRPNVLDIHLSKHLRASP